jgi:hypothetical protein
VNYYYFVEDVENGVPRILSLVERFNPEKKPENWIAHLKEHLRIVVLRRRLFMTYYTVHFTENGDTSVFQSIVRDNREDLLIRLDPQRAASVKEMIEYLLQQARPNSSEREGFTIYELATPPAELIASQ